MIGYRKNIAFCAVALIVLAAYLYTMHPTISPYRDSGDLIVASSTLGIAHPPGYPLYVLLGKAVRTLLPWGNIAYRMNFMSALFGALGILFLMLAINRVYSRALLAVVPALLLAFSPAYWRLSQVSEMYSLNAFLAAVIVWAAAGRVPAPGKERGPIPMAVLGGLSFLCGLSTGNHQTIIFIYPALAWFLFASYRITARQTAYAGAFFFVGMSVYLFLPLRSMTHPLSNWGDPEKLANLIRVMTRADYGGMRLHPEQSTFSWTPSSVLAHLGLYARSLAEQFTVAGALIGGLGILFSLRDRFFRFLLVSFILAGPAFVIFSNLPPEEASTLPILEPHIVLPNLLFAFFIAAGLARFFSSVAVRIAGCVLVAAAVLIHLPACRYRSHFFAYDYGRNLLATVERNGIIYDPDDPTAFITMYLQTVEGRRGDARLAAFFRTRWGYERLKRLDSELLPSYEIRSGQELALTLLDYNRGRFAVYAELPGKFPPGYAAYPQGLLYRLSADGTYAPSGIFFSRYVSHDPLPLAAAPDFFTRQVISYYASAHNNLGLALARLGRYDEARDEYCRALGIDPGLSAAYNNLGTLAYTRKQYDEAGAWFSRVLAVSGENGSILYNLGLTRRAEGKIDQAVPLLSRAWEKYRSLDAANEWGLIMMNSGSTDRAVAIFSSVAQAEPRYMPARFNLGLALRNAGRFAESRRQFEFYASAVSDPAEKEDALRILRSLPR